MNEPNQDIESRLASIRPRNLSPGLEAHIAAAMNASKPTPIAIGFFYGAVAGGAIAASIIVALLLFQPLRTFPSGSSSLAMTNPPNGAVPSNAIASADWRWGDDLGLKFDRRLP